MSLTDFAVYVVSALIVGGGIGWWFSGWFGAPPSPSPISPEQVTALRHEREALLKEDRIYGTRHPYIFSLVCLIAFHLARDGLLKNPQGAKQADDKKQTQLAILGVVSFVIYWLGRYEIKQNTRKAVKAALGDDARPSMPDGQRLKRLKEIEKQLKHPAAQSPQSNSRS